MKPAVVPERALARRLRELRERHWSGARVTQQQIAEAFGGDRPLSESLISSWESARGTVQPPVGRLQAYATFFASRRSIEGGRSRLLSDAELTDEERAYRDQLHEELLQLRGPDTTARIAERTALSRNPMEAPGGPFGKGAWAFEDERLVTIVCAKLPNDLLTLMPYANPANPDYVRAYTHADVDALVELFGHVRAVNPGIDVNFKTADLLVEDDYTNHLVLLGGVDWNPITRDLTRRLHLPVRQVSRPDESPYNGYFEVMEGDRSIKYSPTLDRGATPPTLLEDVAFFYRGSNPYNSRRTITMCNGMFARGTYGAVRALTDKKFRDRNEAYLDDRFGHQKAFGILHRVTIGPKGDSVTPDWANEGNRLYEWPELDA